MSAALHADMMCRCHFIAMELNNTVRRQQECGDYSDLVMPASLYTIATLVSAMYSMCTELLQSDRSPHAAHAVCWQVGLRTTGIIAIGQAPQSCMRGVVPQAL